MLFHVVTTTKSRKLLSLAPVLHHYHLNCQLFLTLTLSKISSNDGIKYALAAETALGQHFAIFHSDSD